MSIQDEAKLRRFADEALGEAEAIASKIDAEVDAERRRRLEEGEKRILSEAYDHIQTELKNIRRQNSQELSRCTMEERRKLLLYREEIMRQVFDRVRERILDFTSTDAYRDYLVKLCVDVLRRQSLSFTIYLSPRDMTCKYAILEGLDNLLDEKLEVGTTEAAPVYSVLPDKNIKLGGARFHSVSGGILINATLDDNLLRQREVFSQMLGPVTAEGGDSNGR
ncbi:MAG: hypothetical protein IJ493_07730 [Clostridia bacterium]|nr:hypothetical protein [Clostridia bacterium]